MSMTGNAGRRWAAVLFMALLPLGASVHAQGSGATEGNRAAADAQDVQREWAEAVAALKSYSAAQRDRALAKGKEALNSMDARIRELEFRSESEWSELSKSAREQRSAALRALRQQRNDAAEWYGQMKQSSTAAWDEVRAGFVDAYGRLAGSFDKAAAEFRKGRSADRK